MPDRDETEARARDCLAAIAAGRADALEALVYLISPRLTGVLRRFLGSEEAARDCAQDVLLAIWRNAGRYDPARGRAMAWIWAVARNRARDALRRRRLRLIVGLEPFADAVAADAPGADRVAAGRDEVARTRVAIEALPDRQRMAILLSAVAELENAEVAEAMDLSVGAVEQLLVRARRTLRVEVGRGNDD